MGRFSRRHASVWSAVARTCVACETQSWKAGSGGGVGQLGPAGSQLLMWLAAWLTPLRCWRDGEIQWPQATTQVGRMPLPFRAFLLSLSSGAHWARALAFQCSRLAAWHRGETSGWPTCGIQAWPSFCPLKELWIWGFFPVDFFSPVYSVR